MKNKSSIAIWMISAVLVFWIFFLFAEQNRSNKSTNSINSNIMIEDVIEEEPELMIKKQDEKIVVIEPKNVDSISSIILSSV